MSVCVSSSLGSNSGSMSMPRHHLPHLMLSGLAGASPSTVGHFPGHLHPHPPSNPPPLPPPVNLLSSHLNNSSNPLGTMDSQCSIPQPQPPPPSLEAQSLNLSLHPNTSSDDQFPNPDMLLALIARNKALEGEWVGDCESKMERFWS